jgi:hypothetical protein
VYDQAELLYLSAVPTLREVSLIGNPLCNLSHGIHEAIDDDAASDIVAEDLIQGASLKDQLSHSQSLEPAAKQNSLFSKTPEEDDEEELARLSLEQQYRLSVLWKAPNVTSLDGVPVSPQELTMAKNLQGGADRALRQRVKGKFLATSANAAGSAANTLRKARSYH